MDMGCQCSKDSSSKYRVSEADNETQLHATLLIQTWYRKYCARLEARRRATWRVFQTLEYQTEKDQMSLYNFFNDLMLHGQGEDNPLVQSITAYDGMPEDDLISCTDPADVSIEPEYEGIHAYFPLDAEQLPKLCEYFRQRKVLHPKYVLTILHETRKLLKAMPSWHQISLENLNHVTVCGDIHGQMDDLLLIFYKNGYPDRTNPYVFNGDMVDRGGQSAEVALLLFAYFLVYPKSLFINRGNHEDQVMNMRYGFVKEIRMKYGRYSAKIVKLYAEVFSWLPVCSVIDKKILVCHGGISNKTNLAEIDKLDRHQYLSILNPPQNDSLPDGHPDRINFKKWRQILDLLWSDPKVQDGCEPNAFRGGGCYFGPDVCAAVLKKHKLKMLIRSHECKTGGYEWDHNNLTLTIFSASNYYEEDSNKGAYARVTKEVTRGDELPQIFQFQVKRRSKSITAGAKVANTEDKALKSLSEKIFTMKSELMEEFVVHDKSQSGFITVTDWCNTMKHVTKFDIPWRTIRPKLVKSHSSSKNLVEYKSTFMAVNLESGGELVSSEMEALYRHRAALNQIFNMIDKDKSGLVSRAEFIDACKILRKANKSKMTDEEIRALAEQIDMNSDGQIDVNEFLEAFTLVFRKQKE